MGHSTIDLFATNEELTTFAREFAEKHDLWVTVIRFPSLVVCGRPWADIESHVRPPIAPLDCLEIVLTFVEPNLDGVGHMICWRRTSFRNGWRSTSRLWALGTYSRLG